MKHKLKSAYVSVLTVLLFCVNASAQWGGVKEPVHVIVAPNHADWNYKIGEDVKFTISVIKYGNLVKDAKVSYQIMPEKMDARISKTETLKKGKIEVNGGTMKTAGFLRCKASVVLDGKTYSSSATAGFEPYKIKPTVTMPKDFNQFWDKAKADLAKIPMDAKWEHLKDMSTNDVDIYQIGLQNFRVNSRIYGILYVPKKEGKYPAILKVPGAGVWPHFGGMDVHAKNAIVFEIRIHGVSTVSQTPNLYTDLYNGPLWSYWTSNMDNKDHYYYKRVYMGCVRSVDFIHSLDKFDGENLMVHGGSQGGALSIVTAALDDRVKSLVSLYPALSDVTGYLHGRAGGWPHMLDKTNASLNNTPARLETIAYYDVVNFAKNIKIPGFYGWGYNDEVCPPTSMFAAYNSISAPKELDIMPDQGHHTYAEQNQKVTNWINSKFADK